MNERRKLLAALSLAALLVTSGCLGFLVGSEPATFEASEATAGDAALAETGYEKTDGGPHTINETVTAAGQERSVQVTNWITQYHRSVDFGVGERDAAAFVVLASPQVEILGKSLNPVGSLDNTALLERMQSQFGGFDDLRKVGERNATMLGEEATVSKFATTTRTNGMEIDVYIHVATVEHGDDHVVAIGVYPQQLDDEEEDRVFTLIESVEHDA